MSNFVSPARASYAVRIGFVSELAGRLHAYGTTAQRLEASVTAIAQKLRLDCEPWSGPTGIILAFSDPERPPGESDTTRVIRLSPGETDLYKLAETDRIAEDVVSGRLDIAAGHAALRALDRPVTLHWRAMQVFDFGLSAAAIAALWRLPWGDVATAGATGLLLGLLDQYIGRRPRMREASEALSAMLAAAVAILVAARVTPLNLNTVIISSLIVFLPGMALTNAVNELTSHHLLSGTARFAGALTTILKLTIGVMISLTLAGLLGIEPDTHAERPQPPWVEWPALVVVAYAFAVLFRTRRGDYPLVMAAAIGGYLISRFVGGMWGSPVGIFAAALAMTAAGNLYARWSNRPGALVRVPGIIMLVPGSASLRGVIDLVQQRSTAAGEGALLLVTGILLALVGGLVLGNVLAPTRRSL